MKTRFAQILVLLATCALAHAQQDNRFQQEALLVAETGASQQVWISKADKINITYYETIQGQVSKTLAIARTASIWLIEPRDYAEAVFLFRSQKYQEALDKFLAVREYYKPLVNIPDNHSTLAAFYAMECMRKLENIDGLLKAHKEFSEEDRASLTRPYQQTQLDIYKLWGLLHAEKWQDVQQSGQEWLEKKLSSAQRAQVAYCVALALEKQEKPTEALDFYQVAITADTGASEVITSKSIINSLRIYLAREEVTKAMQDFDPKAEVENNRGLMQLHTAASLAYIYSLSLNNNPPLPDDLKAFEKYLPAKVTEKKAAAAEGETPKTEEKKEEKPEEEKKEEAKEK